MKQVTIFQIEWMFSKFTKFSEFNKKKFDLCNTWAHDIITLVMLSVVYSDVALSFKKLNIYNF